jgi:4-amino-4-deoxy-L-arabinose transferase-like glycosyltransferase
MRFGVERGLKRVLAHPAALPLAVLVLVIVGGILRLATARQDLFADELATYWVVSTRGLRGVVDTVWTTAEITPPFSFVMSWLTTRIGLSPVLVRLPALVGGIASIPLVYAVGVRTVGRGAALLAATLTTLSPFMIFYSAEARGYGILMALALLSTLSLLLAVDGGQRRWWVVYGLSVCLAAYTHYTAVFVLAAQLGWALWLHPSARRPLLVSTSVAVLLYLPWLTGLKGDMDSPTTDILSDYSTFSWEATRLTLGHWSVGFPFAGPPRTLSDLPGVPALLLLAASICVGSYGIVTNRSRLQPWFAARGGHLGLVVLLALATPLGTALESALGPNVFSTRSLAASWPYLALAVAALVTVGRYSLRMVAAGLAVTAFAVGAVKMLGTDFQRPDYTALAQFADEHPGSVVVDGAGFTPGPLTNLDVESSSPSAEVFRLVVPEQMTTPFAVGEVLPDPADVARRAAAAADGGPIIVMTFETLQPATKELIELLPDGYELTDRKRTLGMFNLEALVFERTEAAG